MLWVLYRSPLYRSPHSSIQALASVLHNLSRTTTAASQRIIMGDMNIAAAELRGNAICGTMHSMGVQLHELESTTNQGTCIDHIFAPK